MADCRWILYFALCLNFFPITITITITGHGHRQTNDETMDPLSNDNDNKLNGFVITSQAPIRCVICACGHH